MMRSLLSMQNLINKSSCAYDVNKPMCIKIRSFLCEPRLIVVIIVAAIRDVYQPVVKVYIKTGCRYVGFLLANTHVGT